MFPAETPSQDRNYAKLRISHQIEAVGTTTQSKKGPFHKNGRMAQHRSD